MDVEEQLQKDWDTVEKIVRGSRYSGEGNVAIATLVAAIVTSRATEKLAEALRQTHA